ncbi:MAG TPA: hypothetical protein VJ764_02540 [Steroidobacteraceae bacterium]|nr:hypothetical protein [Steroidobacteraceae bacterium]
MSLTLLCALSAAVGAQTPTVPDMGAMMQMAEPAPPQPGDAAMTCEQIAREFQSILKKKNVQLGARPDTRAACELRAEMAMTPADQAALSGSSPQAEAARAQKAASMQRASQEMVAANRPMMEAMNDPRLMRLAILADEKHCVVEDQEPPAQAPVADPCGPGVVTPAMVTGGVVPPAPASGAPSARTDPFKPAAAPAPGATSPVLPTPAAVGANDPFVKQGANAPPPVAKQPTTDPFRKD